MKNSFIFPIILAAVFGSSCTNQPAASSDLLRAAQPTATAPVVVKPAIQQTLNVGKTLRVAEDKVNVALAEAEEARQLTARHESTIGSLRLHLAQAGEAVTLALDKLQSEIDEYKALDARRLATQQELKAKLVSATTELATANASLLEADKTIDKQTDELDRYRKLYAIATQSVESNEIVADEWRTKAAKNQHYADTRYSVIRTTIFWTFGATCLLWVALYLYIKSNPASNLASKLLMGLR